MNKINWSHHLNYNYNEVIIKRKTTTLELTIRGGIITRDIKFYIDLDNICIDNVEYKISELKTMYIRYVSTVPNLEIVMGSTFKRVSIALTDCSEQNINNIGKLFDYFIFSDEKSLTRLQSDLYIPMLSNSIGLDDTKKYEYTDNIIDENDASIMLNDKYRLYKILPKEYKSKYSAKKYLVYESKLVNDSYIEIWEDYKNYVEERDKNIKLFNATIKAIIILIIPIIAFTSIDKVYSSKSLAIDIIRWTNFFMPIHFGVLFGLFAIFDFRALRYEISLRKVKETLLPVLFFVLAIILPFPIIFPWFLNFFPLPLYVAAAIALAIILIIKHSRIKKFFLTLLAFFVGFNLCVFFYDLVVPNYRYKEVMVKNEKPSMVEYKYFILKDMITKKTSNGVLTMADSSYVRYKDGEELYCSKEDEKLVNILSELMKYENDVKIEYYCNSGMIKSIDGVEKRDYVEIKAVELESMNKLEE